MSDLTTLIQKVDDLQTDVTVIVTRYEDVLDIADNFIADANSQITSAKQWADHAEDVLIPAPNGNGVDDYSALHWAKKAEAFAGQTITAAADAAAAEQAKLDAQAARDTTLGYRDAADADRIAAEAAQTAAEAARDLANAEMRGNSVLDRIVGGAA